MFDFTKRPCRVAVIGNAGGGKSLLARRLGARIGAPVHSVDDVQWQPGWARTDPALLREIFGLWLAEPAWVIDGWGGMDEIARRFLAADLIVFVDMPIARHYWWATKRQARAWIGQAHRWPPPGCSARRITVRLYRLMWHIHTVVRPRLVALLDQPEIQPRVVVVRSPREMRRLEASLSAVP